MAQNAANDITYYLVIDETHKSDLAHIRHWNNLKVAFEENRIWVKGITEVQVQSPEIKTIPYKSLFYEQAGKLHLLHHLLPHSNIPALLWTPIDRALPVQLPRFNHHYFGIHEKAPVHLVPSETEEPVCAVVVSLKDLAPYIETAPAIRLQPLQWVVINNQTAFITGTPLLPLNGTTYWKRGHFLLPAGYDFNVPLLTNALNQKLNPENKYWIAWETDNTCFQINKEDLQPLSLGSFRITCKQIPVTI